MGNPLMLLAVVVSVASVTNAQDVGVKTFAVTTPSALTTVLCNAETAYTFDITVCEISGNAATVTAVNLYYTNNEYFEDATATGTATPATLGDSATDISVTADGEASNVGAVATVALDAACSSYTHICVVTTTTSDTEAANDDACIALDGGTTSTSNCPAADCGDPGDVTDGQKEGTTFGHGDTVTYTCNEGFQLVGEGTLTCYDGSWDNAKPTCSDAPVTTVKATTEGGTGPTKESGVAGLANGIYCIFATMILTFTAVLQVIW